MEASQCGGDTDSVIVARKERLNDLAEFDVSLYPSLFFGKEYNFATTKSCLCIRCVGIRIMAIEIPTHSTRFLITVGCSYPSMLRGLIIRNGSLDRLAGYRQYLRC